MLLDKIKDKLHILTIRDLLYIKFPNQKDLLKSISRILIFIKFTLKHFYDDSCFMRSAALSYSMLFAVIPLVASFSFLFKSLLNEHYDRILHFTLSFLPYSTDKINDSLLSFVNNALAIGWVGIGVLTFAIISLLLSMETTFDTIWQVKSPTSLPKKFFMLFSLFLLFTIAFSLSNFISAMIPNDAVVVLRGTRVLLSFCLEILAFGILYKYMPNTQVKIFSAFLGGFISVILYNLAKFGLKVYISHAFDYSLIYGSIGAIPIFILSLYILGVIILLGVEISFVQQNYLRLYKEYSKKQ